MVVSGLGNFRQVAAGIGVLLDPHAIVIAGLVDIGGIAVAVAVAADPVIGTNLISQQDVTVTVLIKIQFVAVAATLGDGCLVVVTGLIQRGVIAVAIVLRHGGNVAVTCLIQTGYVAIAMVLVDGSGVAVAALVQIRRVTIANELSNYSSVAGANTILSHLRVVVGGVKPLEGRSVVAYSTLGHRRKVASGPESLASHGSVACPTLGLRSGVGVSAIDLVDLGILVITRLKLVGPVIAGGTSLRHESITAIAKELGLGRGVVVCHDLYAGEGQDGGG
ncbi:hypothetical protein D3C76_594590 [compost metagenome]